MGGEGGGGGGGGAEAQYVTAKTSVWWDIENCNVPRDCDPNAIARNISSALEKMNYCGPVSISAYGDTQGIGSAAQKALSSTGISLHHVPPGVKDASDKKILVDMLFWAVDNPAPANYLLISGDRDFSSALHQLRMRRYNILLAQPPRASAPLVAAAKSVWLWTSLLAGGRPLTEGESQQLGSNSSMLPSDLTQIPVSDIAAQIKQPLESYSENPYPANQTSPSTARGCDNKQKGKNIQRNPSLTNVSKTTSTPLQPCALPAMPDRPNEITRSASAPYTSVLFFGTMNNSGHPVPVLSNPQQQNPELPKKKPDSPNKKKSEGENSKGSCARKGPDLSQNKNKPDSPNKKKSDSENSKGSCAGKGPELTQNKNKPDSLNKKKPDGENSKGSCAGKGPELSQNKKILDTQNSELSSARRGTELKHDHPMKKSRSRHKKKPDGENSKGPCTSRGPELKHDPKIKPDSENKKKPGTENKKAVCENKKKPVSETKKPDSENKKPGCARKGVLLKKSVVSRSKTHISLTKQDKGKKTPTATRRKAKAK